MEDLVHKKSHSRISFDNFLSTTFVHSSPKQTQRQNNKIKKDKRIEFYDQRDHKKAGKQTKTLMLQCFSIFSLISQKITHGL